MPRAAVLSIILAAAAVLLAGLFSIAAQPRSTHAPQAAAAQAATPAPSPTPRPVTAIPGAERQAAANPAVINCYLAAGEQFTPLQYTAQAGRVYVQIRTAAGCHGWIRDR